MAKQLEALIADLKFYAGEAQCHPDPNYCLEFEKLSTPANVLALIAALEQSQQLEIQASEMAVQLSKRLTAAEKRVAELEVERKPVMFIDGDISPADAEKILVAIRDWDEEENKPLPVIEASPLAVKLPDLVAFDDLDANSQDREVVEAIAQCKGWNAAIEAARRMNDAGGTVEGE